MPQHFQIALSDSTATPELISLLRRALHQPVASLKQKIEDRAPIIDEKPHHNAYDEFICSVTALLQDLDDRGIGYTITIDGRHETVEYLRNIFARWHKIGREIQEYDDRITQSEESG